jgi:transcriptional regulator of acetoin/glycerol metabolism
MKKCLKCGSYIPRGHGYKVDQKYCSSNCHYTANMASKEDIIVSLNKNDNISVSAELLGVTKQTLYRWLKRYHIKREVVYR